MGDTSDKVKKNEKEKNKNKKIRRGKRNKSKKLKLFATNCDGVKTKMESLETNINTLTPSVIMLQ